MSSISWLVFGLFLLSPLAGGEQTSDLAAALCDGIRFGAIPHPTDCRQYYLCVESTPVLSRCSPDFVFDPSLSFCVHRPLYSCDGETTAAPRTTTVPSTDSSSPADCAEASWESHFCWNHISSLIRNPINCTQYIDCELDPPRNRDCPSGKVFSLAYQDCFPGSEQTCSLAPVGADFCADKSTGTYAHPYQCDRFVTCIRGAARVDTCPSEYVFDIVAMRCAQGDMLECSSLLI